MVGRERSAARTARGRPEGDHGKRAPRQRTATGGRREQAEGGTRRAGRAVTYHSTIHRRNLRRPNHHPGGLKGRGARGATEGSATAGRTVSGANREVRLRVFSRLSDPYPRECGAVVRRADMSLGSRERSSLVIPKISDFRRQRPRVRGATSEGPEVPHTMRTGGFAAREQTEGAPRQGTGNVVTRERAHRGLSAVAVH